MSNFVSLPAEPELSQDDDERSFPQSRRAIRVVERRTVASGGKSVGGRALHSGSKRRGAGTGHRHLRRHEVRHRGQFRVRRADAGVVRAGDWTW